MDKIISWKSLNPEQDHLAITEVQNAASRRPSVQQHNVIEDPIIVSDNESEDEKEPNIRIVKVESVRISRNAQREISSRSGEYSNSEQPNIRPAISTAMCSNSSRRNLTADTSSAGSSSGNWPGSSSNRLATPNRDVVLFNVTSLQPNRQLDDHIAIVQNVSQTYFTVDQTSGRVPQDNDYGKRHSVGHNPRRITSNAKTSMQPSGTTSSIVTPPTQQRRERSLHMHSTKSREIDNESAMQVLTVKSRKANSLQMHSEQLEIGPNMTSSCSAQKTPQTSEDFCDEKQKTVVKKEPRKQESEVKKKLKVSEELSLYLQTRQSTDSVTSCKLRGVPAREANAIDLATIRALRRWQTPKQILITPRLYPLRFNLCPESIADQIIEISSDTGDSDGSDETTYTIFFAGSESKQRQAVTEQTKSEKNLLLKSKESLFSALGLVTLKEADIIRNRRPYKSEVMAVLKHCRSVRKYIFNPSVAIVKANCLYVYALQKNVIKVNQIRLKPAANNTANRETRRFKALKEKADESNTESKDMPGSSNCISTSDVPTTPTASTAPTSPKAPITPASSKEGKCKVKQSTHKMFLPVEISNLKQIEDQGFWTSFSSAEVKKTKSAPIVYITEKAAKGPVFKYFHTERFCSFCTFSSLNVFTLRRHLQEDHKIDL